MKKIRLRAVRVPAIPDRTTRMAVVEEICRRKVSEIIQAVLIAEADEFLGCITGVPGKSKTGYRDGYEEHRTIASGSTPVTIRRPRVRESAAPFESEILPPYKRRFPELDKTMHELWLQGLSTRDFEPSLRALLGEITPLSPSTVSRVNRQFLDDCRTWSRRHIADKYVYIWADGVYLDAGAEDEKRVMLAVIGVDIEGEKELLALDDAFGESTESWTALFENLRERGLKNVATLIADGAQGIWKAFSAVFPRAKQQRCWLHKMRNVEDRVPEKHRKTIHTRMLEIMHAASRQQAERLIEKLAKELSRQYPKAAACLRDDVARMIAYYAFPKSHWKHLRTTNIIESNFDVVRSRTNVCKRLRQAESATYLPLLSSNWLILPRAQAISWMYRSPPSRRETSRSIERTIMSLSISRCSPRIACEPTTRTSGSFVRDATERTIRSKLFSRHLAPSLARRSSTWSRSSWDRTPATGDDDLKTWERSLLSRSVSITFAGPSLIMLAHSR
ncbi:MAG: IS256 family transposase [Candidatus Baltobacteraceae bacterium]